MRESVQGKFIDYNCDRTNLNDVKELQLYKDLDNEQLRHQRCLDEKIKTTYANEVPFDPEIVNKNFTDKDFKSEEGNFVFITPYRENVI